MKPADIAHSTFNGRDERRDLSNALIPREHHVSGHNYEKNRESFCIFTFLAKEIFLEYKESLLRCYIILSYNAIYIIFF